MTDHPASEAGPLTTLREATEDALLVFVDTQWENAYREKLPAALAQVETLIHAARVVNGDGVGEFNTRTLTSLLPLRAALARFDKELP